MKKIIQKNGKEYRLISFYLETFLAKEFDKIAEEKGIEVGFLLSWVAGLGFRHLADEGIVAIPESIRAYAREHQKEWEEHS